jgi:hypothetical protein
MVNSSLGSPTHEGSSQPLKAAIASRRLPTVPTQSMATRLWIFWRRINDGIVASAGDSQRPAISAAVTDSTS